MWWGFYGCTYVHECGGGVVGVDTYVHECGGDFVGVHTYMSVVGVLCVHIRT